MHRSWLSLVTSSKALNSAGGQGQQGFERPLQQCSCSPHHASRPQRPERAILHAQVDQAQKDLAAAREELGAARVEFKGYGSTDQLGIFG